MHRHLRQSSGKGVFVAHFRLILTILLLPGIIPAQGTRGDYERRESLQERFRGRMVVPEVEPHWFGGGERFWYRKSLGEGNTEFLLVDAKAGTRTPAFDHARLARLLSAATGREVSAARLPIRSIEFPGGDAGLFIIDGKMGRWRCRPDADEVEGIPSEEGKNGDNASFLRAPRPSRGGGEEVHIRFYNRTGSELELLWNDLGGVRRSYGRLGPGESRIQHTFQGHVWIFRDARTGRIAIYSARWDGEEVSIGSDQLKAERRSPSPKASGRSPDGRREVEIRNHDVFVGGKRVTEGGTEGDGFEGPVFWAPDSLRFVVMKRRAPDPRRIHIVESSPQDQLQPKLHSIDYVKPGDDIAVSRPHLFDVSGGKPREIPVPDERFAQPWSIGELRWLPDSSEFVFLYNQRGHQLLRIVAVNGMTGASRTVIEETSRTFIDYAGKRFSRFIANSGEWIWMSERDGWNHLHRYDHATGRVINQITKGKWVVRGVDHVDEEKRQIWFRAGGIHPGQDPYHVHHCRVDFDGSNLVVLTEGDGTHSVEFSPDRRFLIATYSRVDQPPVVELRRGTDGGKVCELERADGTPLLEAGWRAPERFVAKGRDGKTDIHGVIFRPSRFDPQRSYPVIEKIYAGPHGAFVPKEFRSHFQTQSLAELGFVVVQIDGMGTSHRSKAFHDVAWKNLRDSGFPDRICWMKAAAEKYPSMDLTRVGIYGGSAGGQSTVAALLWHGDFYKVGVADCGCHDNRMDKIWWNELWMGWPVDGSYAENSNVVNAHRLTGNLLLTVGEMDRNVDPASTMQVVDALIKADKDFDLIVVPGGGHGVGEKPYLKRRRADYFVRHLLGVEPRR